MRPHNGTRFSQICRVFTLSGIFITIIINHTMFKKPFYFGVLSLIITAQSVFALQPAETARYFNGPTVSSITTTGATVSLSAAVLAGMTDYEKSQVYFEYTDPGMMCIAIYPTPSACLPKKTELGKTEVVLTNLNANATYTVKYKRDNTIRCITTPCPGNEFESAAVEFKTLALGETPTPTPLPVPADNIAITKNLWLGSHGAQVITLQTVLIQQGYMTGAPTGYFGILTFKAVKQFQKAHNISPTGFVGALTRAVLSKMTVAPGTVGLTETFEGTVTAYSTQCFSDGECSITVDGKKIVTTIGWSPMIVGKVTGIPDFGSIENNVGAHAKVYAKKTDTGYTLYGSADYYIKIMPAAKGKLQAGSVTTSPSLVQGSTWVWQKTVANDVVTVPNKADRFTLMFGNDGNASGTTDCNGFGSAYTFGSDGFVKFGPMMSTRMFCEGSQELLFTGALAKVSRYSIDGSGVLVLTLSDNGGTMYFVKK